MRASNHPLLHHPAWRLLAWLGVLLIAALLGLAVATRQPALVLAMGIFLAAGLGVLLAVKHLPGVFTFLLVLAALLNGAGGTYQWFEAYRWFDEAVHTFTGFAGLAAIGYLYARVRPVGRAGLVLWCTAMGLALGIGWEVIEELVGELEVVDTATDLLLDTAGAALGGLAAWHALHAERAQAATAARAA